MEKTAKFGVVGLVFALMVSGSALGQGRQGVPRPPVGQSRGGSIQNREVPRPPASTSRPSEAYRSGEPQGPVSQPSAQPDQQNRGVPRPPGYASGTRSGDWLRRNMNLSPEQQKRELQNDPSFKKLPRDEQQRLMQRLDRFNSLSPVQKQRWVDRMDWIDRLPPEQHQQVQQMRQEMQQLDPSRRQAIRQALGSMRGMSAEQQRQAIESNRNFNDKERNIMRGITDMRSRRDRELGQSRADHGGQRQSPPRSNGSRGKK